MNNKIDFTVTYFNNISDVTNYDLKKRCRTSTIISRMKDPSSKLALKVTNLRLIDDPDKRKEAKKSLPVIMWQGMFKHRSNSGCDSLNGLMCFDIDHKTDPEIDRIKEEAAKWGCTYCCFRSPSGDGLKVVIHTDNYDIDKYSNCYRQVERIFIDHFGIKPDPSCEDLSHACYISYDPELYHNERTLPWHFEYKPEFDKPVNSQYQRSYTPNEKPELTPAEMFISQMNKQRSPLTDDQIIKILDIRWSKFQDNYKDGNRTHSVFVQASKLCLAGIDEDMAIDYLKSKFLPTGFEEWKLRHEVGRAYQKNLHLYCSERLNYKPYSQYKREH